MHNTTNNPLLQQQQQHQPSRSYSESSIITTTSTDDPLLQQLISPQPGRDRTETRELSTRFNNSSNRWPCSRQQCLRLVAGLLGICFILFAIAIGYLQHNGAFTKVKRNLLVVNGTAIEPNTKMKFPIHIDHTMTGETRPQVLVGLYLKTRHVPEIAATLHVFVQSIYLDLETARKYLKSYHNIKEITSREQFDTIVDIVDSGLMEFITIQYNMKMTIPGTRMHDAWIQSLIELWETYPEMTSKRIKTLQDCFSDTFQFKHRQFRVGDQFTLEWSNVESSPPKDSIRGGPTLLLYNSESIKECPDHDFGKAVFMHESLENPFYTLNLFRLIFEN
jgi:hypothetical protein